MRLSEITNEHKPYIRVTKDNRRIEIPLKLMPVKLEHPTAYYLGFEPSSNGRGELLPWIGALKTLLLPFIAQTTKRAICGTM